MGNFRILFTALFLIFTSTLIASPVRDIDFPGNLRKRNDIVGYKCLQNFYKLKDIDAAKEKACKLLNKGEKTVWPYRYPREFKQPGPGQINSQGRNFFIYPILRSGKVYKGS